jgi:hypothetical protein
MERKISFFGKDIKIYQAWFSGELGSTVWDSVCNFQSGFVQKYLVHNKKKNGPSQQNHFMMYVDCFDAINLCSFGCCVTNREKANFFLRVFLETPK